MDKSHERVRELLAGAGVISNGLDVEAPRPATPPKSPMAGEPDGEGFIGPPPWDEGEEGEAGPSDTDQTGVDRDVVVECSKLDHSDTDNGQRLIRHFGQDLAVLETENVASAEFGVWMGDHWNFASGIDAAFRVAQKIGGRIALESEYLTLTSFEAAAVAKARVIKAQPEATWSEADKGTLKAAAAAPLALESRQARRRAFGVSSKNLTRLKAMLACAAPHLTYRPDAFNADAHLTATKNHTLRFVREVCEDLENPDPDGYRTTIISRLEVIPGHRRADLITKLMPVAYDPEAKCPKFAAFVEEFLPNANVRRAVQVFSGLGMTGIGLQRVMFHYGNGANGKSAYMETLMRIMGPLGVGLPAASLVGENRATGQQASPDIARLYGARIVRVAELPAEEPVKEELVKLLTGGESMPVRNLFKGFFEFTPFFKAHMSGNGYPRIDGTDNGIWRRILVIPWTQTIPEERQRELRDVVAEFFAEGPGILNWLIEGVLEFLRDGFIVPTEIKVATKEYRDEMDPIGQFATACVKVAPDQRVRARSMYNAYEAWSMANGKRPLSENKFGRVMKKKFARDDTGNTHVYVDCVLHNVPERPHNDTGLPEQRHNP